VGPKVVKRLVAEASEFLERNAERGLQTIGDLVGLRRQRVVPHSQIKRPEDSDYQGGHEPQEGYADAPREAPREGVRS
jgi:hypothetical protein